MAVAILVVLAILIIIDIIVFANDEYGWSLGIMAASIALAYWGTPYVKEFIESSGWTTIFTHYVPIYLAVGFVTAVGKWFMFSLKIVERIKETKADFEALRGTSRSEERKSINYHNLSEQAQKRKEFVDYYSRHIVYCEQDSLVNRTIDWESPTAIVDALSPQAKKHVGPITVWIIQWPIVIISTLFQDLLVKLTKHMARLIDLMFSGVTRRLVARVTKGL